MRTLAFEGNAGASIGRFRHQIKDWWMDLPQAVRSPVWPYALSVLTVVFLLLAFHQVVLGAVHQGELLRMATATHSEGVWRCSSLRGQRMRESCLAQMNAAPHDEAPLQNTAAVATVALSR